LLIAETTNACLLGKDVLSFTEAILAWQTHFLSTPAEASTGFAACRASITWQLVLGLEGVARIDEAIAAEATIATIALQASRGIHEEKSSKFGSERAQKPPAEGETRPDIDASVRFIKTEELTALAKSQCERKRMKTTAA